MNADVFADNFNENMGIQMTNMDQGQQRVKQNTLKRIEDMLNVEEALLHKNDNNGSQADLNSVSSRGRKKKKKRKK